MMPRCRRDRGCDSAGERQQCIQLVDARKQEGCRGSSRKGLDHILAFSFNCPPSPELMSGAWLSQAGFRRKLWSWGQLTVHLF